MEGIAIQTPLMTFYKIFMDHFRVNCPKYRTVTFSFLFLFALYTSIAFIFYMPPTFSVLVTCKYIMQILGKGSHNLILKMQSESHNKVNTACVLLTLLV